MPSASTDVFFSKVLPVLTGFGVAATLTLGSISLPIVIAQGREIQKLQDQMETVSSDVSKFQATADKLEKHMTETEGDPARVVAQVLGTASVNRKLGSSVVIGNDVVVFPKDAAAESDLVRAGYREQAITPTVSGYVARVTDKLMTDPGTQRPGK